MIHQTTANAKNALEGKEKWTNAGKNSFERISAPGPLNGYLWVQIPLWMVFRTVSPVWAGPNEDLINAIKKKILKESCRLSRPGPTSMPRTTMG